MAAPTPPADVAANSPSTSAWANSVTDAVQQLIADLYPAGALGMDWSMITGKPAGFAPAAHTHADAATGGTVAYGVITGKPATFAPSAHASSHAAAGADKLTPQQIGAWNASSGSSGKTIYVQTSAPSAMVDGDVWIKG